MTGPTDVGFTNHHEWAMHMEISLNGDSAFLIKSSAGAVICDPANADEAQYTATSAADDTAISALLFSAADRQVQPPNQQNGPAILTRPGEYEVGELGIRGVALLASDQPEQRGTVTGYRIDAERLAVMMLGDPGSLPDNRTRQLIGHVDVLLIDTTRIRLKPNELASLISTIEPSLVCVNGINRETGEQTPELQAIYKDIGGTDQPTEPVLRQNVTKSSLPDGRRLVVLRSR